MQLTSRASIGRSCRHQRSSSSALCAYLQRSPGQWRSWHPAPTGRPSRRHTWKAGGSGRSRPRHGRRPPCRTWVRPRSSPCLRPVHGRSTPTGTTISLMARHDRRPGNTACCLWSTASAGSSQRASAGRARAAPHGALISLSRTEVGHVRWRVDQTRNDAQSSSLAWWSKSYTEPDIHLTASTAAGIAARHAP